MYYFINLDFIAYTRSQNLNWYMFKSAKSDETYIRCEKIYIYGFQIIAAISSQLVKN